MIRFFVLITLLTAAARAQSLLPTGWDAKTAGDKVMGGLVNTTGPSVKGAHDAEFVCVGSRAFIVAEANDVKPGESADWPYVYVTLAVVDLTTLKVEKTITFAKGGQAFANETLPPGACFVPRIIQKDDKTLRCYFASEEPKKRQAQTWIIDFDLERLAFENRLQRAKIKTAAGVFDMQPQYFHADAAANGFARAPVDFGLYIFDAFKVFDGKTYVALNNYPGGQNALAKLNETLDTFEVLGHYNRPHELKLTESAVNRLPDGTWMAICRQEGGNTNYVFTTSPDGTQWQAAGHRGNIPNGASSKPTFDNFGDLYYLGWQEATKLDGVGRSVFNIDVSRDGTHWERKYRFESVKSFQYPTFHEHDGSIWLTVTQGDSDPSRKERIMFGKLESSGKAKAVLRPGVKLFTDRDYVVDELPKMLHGLPFFRTSIAQLDVECIKLGMLYAVTPTQRPKASSQEMALRGAGFEKVPEPEFQFFPGELNRVSLYRKEARKGERFRFQKMVLLAEGPGVELRPFQPPPPRPWNENRGEHLYNGIVLPEVWPPQHFQPESVAPMPVPYVQHPPKVIPIDLGRQLFVDDFLIERTDLKRTWHTAKKFEGNPVFKAETKHELAASNLGERGQEAVCYLGHGGVFFDPLAKHFKLFYTAGWRGPLALATSADLKTWVRPELGILEDNLLLAAGKDAGGDNSMWLDLNAAKDSERLKFLTDRGRDGHGLQTSSDGREWSQPVPTGTAADYCSFFFNPFRKVWCYSIKQGGARGRCRWYHESSEFLSGADWSRSVYWCNADSLDEPDALIGVPPQLYSLSAVAYESILLGEFQVHLGPDNRICDEGKFPKITELKLGFSRDGFHWHRPDRRPFIAATRKEGDWDRGYVHGTTGVCLVMDDQLWFPYCAYSGIAPSGKRGMYTGASIGLATLRRDGFASMDAQAQSGTLETRPVTFNGSHLFVNVEAAGGELRVEALDENNQVIAISKPIRTDSTKQLVTWQDGKDLSALAGKPMRFRFHLSAGRLYAFWVSKKSSGASEGWLGGGGPGYSGVQDQE